ncbi:MAG: type II secretion system protein GspL [Gammaproteobacteria bacterium]
MSETLYVRLPPAAAPGDGFAWVLLAADGAIAASGSRVAGDAAEPLPSARRVVAFVPGAEVSVASAELPARSAGRALQLAPYALEEQLAGDIEDLHFAAGPVDEAGKTPFVVCERASLDRWLAVLAAAGLVPNAVVPDFLAIPDNPGHVVVWIEADEVAVRHPGQWPLLLDADPLEAALEVAGVLGSDVSPHVLCYCTPGQYHARETTLGAVEAQVASWRTQLLEESGLGALAVSAHHVPPLNLLQGTYASRGASGGSLARWRMPLLLGAALLLAGGATLLMEHARVAAEAKRLDGLIADAARQAMPDVQRLVDPRRQVEARLAQSPGGGQQDSGLLSILEAVAATRDVAPGMTINNLNYFSGTADLQLEIQDPNLLEQVRGAIAARGHTVQVQTIPGNAAGAVSARMRISRAGEAE